MITIQVLVPLNLNELASQKLVYWKNVDDEVDEGDSLSASFSLANWSDIM